MILFNKLNSYYFSRATKNEKRRHCYLLKSAIRAFGELLQDKNEATRVAIQHLHLSDVKMIDAQLKGAVRRAAGLTQTNYAATTRRHQYTVRALQRAKHLFTSHKMLTNFLDQHVKSDKGLNFFADASTTDITAETLLQLKLFVQVKARNKLWAQHLTYETIDSIKVLFCY